MTNDDANSPGDEVDDDQQRLVPIHLLHFAHRSQNC